MTDRPVTTIRRESPEDADQVRLVNMRAFDRPDEAALVDALRPTPGAVSLVAVLDAHIVGHILFTPVQVERMKPAISAVGLAPMAVLPEHQRLGVGSALVRAGLDQCRALGHGFVVVVGHPGYYPRFGFVPASAKGLECEYPVPPEVFMVLELRAGALDEAGGLVRYRPEFAGA
jgi:putative acetyltransferase